jgi:hypothetical protein
MQERKLGRNGAVVSALGLSAMGMSGMYGPSDRRESIATIQAALDAGITLIDAGDFYGMGHNEMLIAEAVKGVSRDKYVLSVKFGALRDPAGGWIGFDGRPAAVKTFLAYSLVPSWRGGHRHLQARPSRSDCADRRDGRRNLGARSGGLCPLHRSLRSRSGDHSPCRRAPGDRRHRRAALRPLDLRWQRWRERGPAGGARRYRVALAGRSGASDLAQDAAGAQKISAARIAGGAAGAARRARMRSCPALRPGGV